LNEILVVCRNDALSKVITKRLDKRGYPCRAEWGVDEAIDYWEKNHPDLIIIDPRMPDDGYRLIEKVVNESPNQKILLFFCNSNSYHQYLSRYPKDRFPHLDLSGYSDLDVLEETVEKIFNQE